MVPSPALPVRRRRERLTSLGVETLSLGDLLALVGASGTVAAEPGCRADALLDRFGSLARLARATATELRRHPGVGPAGAARLVAAFELGRRVEQEVALPRPFVRSASDVYPLVAHRLRGLAGEVFLVLLLSSKGRLDAIRTISRGTLDASLVHPREVFAPAIREAAASIVLVHNHPSGDPTPSPEDLLVTDRLVEVGRLIGIEVVDHIVVGHDSYVSLRESGATVRGEPVQPAAVRVST